MQELSMRFIISSAMSFPERIDFSVQKHCDSIEIARICTCDVRRVVVACF